VREGSGGHAATDHRGSETSRTRAAPPARSGFGSDVVNGASASPRWLDGEVLSMHELVHELAGQSPSGTSGWSAIEHWLFGVRAVQSRVDVAATAGNDANLQPEFGDD